MVNSHEKSHQYNSETKFRIGNQRVAIAFGIMLNVCVKKLLFIKF